MSKKSAKGCTIRVLDKDYVINCEENEKEMLIQSADFLNQRVKEIRTSSTISGGEKIMVLTALNICYDYLKLQQQKSEDTSQLEYLQKLNKKISDALDKYRQAEVV